MTRSSRFATPVRLGLIVAALLTVAGCGRGPGGGPDQVLYQRAHDATLARNETEAKRLYRDLVQRHPDSPFSADAHVALAELLFNQGDYDAALLEYEQARASPTAKSWGYALYKQGWCHLNQNRPAQAMEIFQRVIELEKDDRLPAEAGRGLVEAARRDLVKAYAQASNLPAGPDKDPSLGPHVEGALDYFTRWGGGAVTDLLDLLAERYFEQEQLAESQSIYRDLIAGHIDSPRLCAWQNSLVRIAMVTGTTKEQVAEVQRLGAVLARVEHLDGMRSADRDSCREHLRDTLKELALASHKRGQKEQAMNLYELVDPLYRQYLTRFSDEQDATTMTFYHGEVLWTLGRWDEAAQEYLRVMQRDPRGKFVREAAYAYVLSTKNALKLDDEPAPGPGPRKPSPLSPAERKMIAAMDIYIAHVPDGHEALVIEYRRARMFYEHGEYDQAAAMFRAVVDRHSQDEDELVGMAINSELDCLQVLRRTDQLVSRAQALQTSPAARRDKALAATLAAVVQLGRRQTPSRERP